MIKFRYATSRTSCFYPSRLFYFSLEPTVCEAKVQGPREASCTYLQKEYPGRHTSTDPRSESCDHETRGPQYRYQRFVDLGCWVPKYLPPLVFCANNREARRTRGWNRSASLPGAPPTHGSAGKVETRRMPAGRLVGFHHLRLWLRSPLINPLQS